MYSKMQSERRLRKVHKSVIDICRNGLIKSIKCDVPCSEGYGPDNLVTNNLIERSKGFLAERFIKPPVYLTLELKSEVDIEYVAINCCVGAQKSKGLELFSQSTSKGRYYESVASGVLTDDKVGFVFHRFDVNAKDRFGENYCYLKFKSSRFLSSVTSVRIKIFCTNGVSIPAVGKMEIWGTPLNSVLPRHNGNTTLQSQTVTRPSEGFDELDLTTKPCNSLKPKILNPTGLLSVLRRTKLDPSFNIPEDFIDPITCEVMIQPIILPSGKAIDSSTLKSHEKAELRWGRGPSDPFTGIPFSEFNKPIAASDLKSRIDKFLTDNCNVLELKSIPRALGTKDFFHTAQNQSGEVVVSKLVTNTNLIKSQVKNLPSEYCSSNTAPGSLKPTRPTGLKRSHAQIDSSTSSTLKLPDDSRSDSAVLSPSPSSNVNHIEISRCRKKLSSGAEERYIFQQRMEQSLELALKSTLAKLPKFTCDKTESVEGLSTALCNVCKSSENLFSIPCNHFVCRFCLLQVKRDKMFTLPVCVLCNCEYKTSDVQKVHIR